jgi:F-type H+-transporting ATPase subunit a
MAHDPKDHVMDAGEFEFFTSLFGDEVSLHLPKIGGVQITKFMILELIAAGLILLIYIPLSRRIRSGSLPEGRWWNCWEALLTFVRNEIAKPNLDPPPGHHGEGHEAHAHDHHHEKEHAHHEVKPVSGLSEADKYVPFLWTVFLFVLFCNLLGMIPYMGSPTANIYVTGALALCAFVMFHAAAMVKMGPLHYFAAQWPKIDIDLPVVGKAMGITFSLLLFVIEMFGTIIKGGVLAIRLFANMFAGHMVLATILLFIVTVGEAAKEFTPIWGTVTVASVIGVVLLSLLELFVAFLQAFVFTFLTALFMGMSLHPQH